MWLFDIAFLMLNFSDACCVKDTERQFKAPKSKNTEQPHSYVPSPFVCINQSINQRFLKWPKWYATARTTAGNKTVGTQMS